MQRTTLKSFATFFCDLVLMMATGCHLLWQNSVRPKPWRRARAAAHCGKVAVIVALLLCPLPELTASANVVRASAVAPPSLVGVWQAEVVENGSAATIFWRINRNGTTVYRFVYSDGSVGEGSGTWSYRKGIVYEAWGDGYSGSGRIVWVDNDHFVITILKNQNPGDRGRRRVYHRVG